MIAMSMRVGYRIRALALIGFAASSAVALTATSRIVTAANTFVSTLDEKQRQRVLFAFNDEQQRARWSNFPVRMVPRAGLSIGELSGSQRSAALALVSSALSRRGFEKVFHPRNSFRKRSMDAPVRARAAFSRRA